MKSKRKQHSELKHVNIPKISNEQGWDLSNGNSLIPVTCTSDSSFQRMLLEAEGRYMLEFKDKPRLKLNDCECSDDKIGISKLKCHRGFIFTGQDSDGDLQVIGGCLFQWRRFGDGYYYVPGVGDMKEPTGWWEARHPHDCWSMQWVWIKPEARRKKVLTNAWPIFRMLFGIQPTSDFYMEAPYSDEFAKFLKSQGYRIYRDCFGSMEHWKPSRFQRRWTDL